MLSAGRVAARYLLAESLTKDWLMGVRRGWLKLMDPPIGDWQDVHQAYQNLSLFVSRLKDQVFYVRRGPYTGTFSMSEGAKVLVLLGQLASALADLKRRAQHWQTVQEGTGLPGQNPEDGQKMLNLYRTDFPEASRNSLEISPGKYRNVDLTKLMDRVLKLLREDVQRIKDHDEKHPDQPYGDLPHKTIYKEFDLHGMKVVIDDSAVTQSEIIQYIRFFEYTYEKMKARGFAKAWYGTIFVQCEKCGGTNPYGNYGVAGDYRVGPDTVQIYSRPDQNVPHMVSHELGHRYWYKQMTQAQRGRFEDLVKVHKGPKPTDPEQLEDWQKELDRDQRPVFPVSEYGGASTAEAFAEVFSSYVLGKDLSRDQLESFRSVMARAIPMDKTSIRRFTEFLEKEIAELASRHTGPFGSKVLGQWPYEIRAVDGTQLQTYVRLEAVPSNDTGFVIDGGVGFLRGTPIVVVHLNGSLDADALRRGAETHIVRISLYNLLIHELTHVADKYTQGVGDRGLSEDELRTNPTVYYNNPSELHAFMQEVVDQVSERFTYYEKLKKRFGPKALGMLLNMSDTWTTVSPHWNDRNRQKVLKAVYQALEDWEKGRPLVARLAGRYRQARIETIDVVWVEKLRKDFLILLKNLPRVKDYRTADILREALKTYRKNFDELFFKRFLNQRKEEGDGSFEGVRKVAWDFMIELRVPMGYPDEYTREETLFARFEHDKRTWEQRLRTKAQKFWKDLKDTLSYRQDSRVEVEIPDHDRLVLEGFQVEIIGHDPTSDWQQNSFYKFKESLRQYRRKASKTLPWLIQHQLPLVINFKNKLNEGGLYEGDHISIAMSAMAGEPPEWGVHMLAHEMGHHLFKGLDASAREFWSTAIRQDYGPIDLAELLDQWPAELRWATDLVERLAPKDPVLALQVDVLSTGHVGKAWEEREDFEQALQAGTQTVQVPQHPITGYASKNPEESFCEAVGRLVGYGPATVLPEIRRWLDITIPGEVRVATVKRFSDHPCVTPSQRLVQRYRTAASRLEVGKWYKQTFRGDATELYFLVKDVQKNGGWAGTLVRHDTGSRGRPKAKKDSVPKSMAGNWTEIKESDVPAEVKEQV